MYLSIEYWKSALDHIKLEGSNYITRILSLILLCSLNNEYIVDSITMYTDRTVAWSFNEYSKIETLFGWD